MARPLEELQFSSQSEWHHWLEKNHEQETGIWLILFKKSTGIRRTMTHEEALEEALCFGWIDNLIRRIDDERFAFKFTPRRNIAKWSEANKRTAKRLIEEGRMTVAGSAKLGQAIDEDKKDHPEQPSDLVPDFMRSALEKDEKAWKYFSSLPLSYRRNYIRWITSAKRPLTRERRLEEARQLLRRGEKLGMK